MGASLKYGLRIVIQEYPEGSKCFDTLDLFEVLDRKQVLEKINKWKDIIKDKYPGFV